MKTLYSLLKFLLLGILIFSLTSSVKGQNNKDTKDTMSDLISQDDLKAVLEILNIELFKFNVNFSSDQKCKVILYQEEYEKRNKLREVTIWGTNNPYRATVDGTVTENPLNFIRIISKKESSPFLLNINMGEFRLNDYKIKIDSTYKKPHACKSFKLPEDYNIGNKIPLLLIGSFWDSTSKDGKMKIERFCSSNADLLGNLSDKAFDEMPHYYIIGIRIE